MLCAKDQNVLLHRKAFDFSAAPYFLCFKVVNCSEYLALTSSVNALLGSEEVGESQN